MRKGNDQQGERGDIGDFLRRECPIVDEELIGDLRGRGLWGGNF